MITHRFGRAITLTLPWAGLLVVGSRRLGAFAGILLGSTSQDCVQHPTTPVVVIHHAMRVRLERST
jgi:Universal stress protein family